MHRFSFCIVFIEFMYRVYRVYVQILSTFRFYQGTEFLYSFARFGFVRFSIEYQIFCIHCINFALQSVFVYS